MSDDSGANRPVQSVALDALTSAEGAKSSLLDGNLDVVKNVKVKLEVVVGEAELSIGELMALHEGAVLKLDRSVDAPVDIVLDGRVIARGQLVVVDDSFGIRVTEHSL